VGLADDGNALFHNPAGLAWGEGLSVLSSVEIRPHTAGYGHISACLENLAVGLHYFDFGDVPETDEFGNVLGTFSYRNCGLIVGTGVSAADVPFLSDLSFASCLAFGLSAKLVAIDTLEAGDGNGLAADLSLLLRADDPWLGEPYVTRLSFGILAESLFATPITYGSGHVEEFEKRAVVGASIELLHKIIVSLAVTSRETVHFGAEWSPASALSVRAGLKRDGVWMWSFGAGVHRRQYAVDYAVAIHPYLRSQYRASFGVSW